MSPEHAALTAWLESDEGKSATNHETLGLSEKDAQYLRNRIWHAFTAGVAAGKKIAAERILRKQVRDIEETLMISDLKPEVHP